MAPKTNMAKKPAACNKKPSGTTDGPKMKADDASADSESETPKGHAETEPLVGPPDDDDSEPRAKKPKKSNEQPPKSRLPRGPGGARQQMSRRVKDAEMLGRMEAHAEHEKSMKYHIEKARTTEQALVQQLKVQREDQICQLAVERAEQSKLRDTIHTLEQELQNLRSQSGLD